MDMGQKADSLPGLVLAYVGDAVYELYIRSYLVNKGITKVNELHREAVRYVKATTQSRVLHQLETELQPDEIAVVKRGRNAKSGRAPKNTQVIDYRYSTAFEALIGYMQIKGDRQRLDYILAKAVELAERED
ncbi:MAG: ribonuclease III [Clostridia bacterium]|nr:ribonuclease III [Clostridia bacterium]